MEAHDQSAIEGPDDKTIASLPRAGPTPAVDPLANASCLRCGYSLRGLTENRCPECGTPFDPEEMASSYLPEWPRLMAWYLAALAVAWTIELVSRTAYAMSSSSSLSSILTRDLSTVGWLWETLVTVCLAFAAISGLRQRTDWGRKTAIGLFVAQALPSPPLLVWVIFMLCQSQTTTGVSPVWQLFRVAEAIGFIIPTAIPAVALACTLLTGLRRRSLRRGRSQPLLLLPIQSFHPRKDWVLLLVVILAASAVCDLGGLGMLFFYHVLMLRNASAAADSWWQMVVSLGPSTVVLGIQCGWTAWAAVRIWREPDCAARRLRTLTFIAAGLWLAAQIRWLIMDLPRYTSGPVHMNVPPLIVGALLYVVAATVMPLALYLYASRALPPEALARVARPQA